jgi:hypothetical protein
MAVFLLIPDRCVIDLWIYGLAFSHRSRSGRSLLADRLDEEPPLVPHIINSSRNDDLWWKF